VGKPEAKITRENVDADWKIMLEWIINKCDVRVWIGFMWLRILVAGFC
jgi:hypothetical protein